MPRTISCLTHLFSIMWLGLMAGFFWAYSINVSQALAQVDGATYASVQALLNQHVRHTAFFVFFFGAPAWVLLSLLPAWRQWRSAWWVCLATAGLLYALGIVVFTAQVNLPNNASTESWHPQHLPRDWVATRDAWRLANHWRTAVSVLSFVLACVALAIRPASVAVVPAVTSLPSRA